MSGSLDIIIMWLAGEATMRGIVQSSFSPVDLPRTLYSNCTQYNWVGYGGAVEAKNSK